jgi:hypothetical protein
MLSPQGTMTVSERINSLIIVDDQDAIQRVNAWLEQFDDHIADGCKALMVQSSRFRGSGFSPAAGRRRLNFSAASLMEDIIFMNT